jgi:hypothetical protein
MASVGRARIEAAKPAIYLASKIRFIYNQRGLLLGIYDLSSILVYLRIERELLSKLKEKRYSK